MCNLNLKDQRQITEVVTDQSQDNIARSGIE